MSLPSDTGYRAECGCVVCIYWRARWQPVLCAECGEQIQKAWVLKATTYTATCRDCGRFSEVRVFEEVQP